MEGKKKKIKDFFVRSSGQNWQPGKKGFLDKFCCIKQIKLAFIYSSFLYFCRCSDLFLWSMFSFLCLCILSHRCIPPDTVNSLNAVWNTHGAANKHALIYGHINTHTQTDTHTHTHTLTHTHTHTQTHTHTHWLSLGHFQLPKPYLPYPDHIPKEHIFFTFRDTRHVPYWMVFCQKFVPKSSLWQNNTHTYSHFVLCELQACAQAQHADMIIKQATQPTRLLMPVIPYVFESRIMVSLIARDPFSKGCLINCYVVTGKKLYFEVVLKIYCGFQRWTH